MTLQQVAMQYHISEQDFCRKLGVPATVTGQRLGHLRKRYGFSLEELHTYVNNKD